MHFNKKLQEKNIRSCPFQIKSLAFVWYNEPILMQAIQQLGHDFLPIDYNCLLALVPLPSRTPSCSLFRVATPYQQFGLLHILSRIYLSDNFEVVFNILQIQNKPYLINKPYLTFFECSLRLSYRKRNNEAHIKQQAPRKFE